MSESKHDDLPPQKRQRTDSDEDSRTRDAEYWYEDGNVVLQAEDTLFCFHRSILSRSSPVFKDTFAMPQPKPLSQENDQVDGCPVIPLSDTAEDIGNLISFLYDGEKTLNFGSEIPINTLGSILRLGRKYVISYLENKALEILRDTYPTKLLDWDQLQSSDPGIEHVLETTRPTTEAISIAHEFRLFTIMPAAYATYIQQQYLDDIPGDDRLPEKARQRCTVGYARIQEFIKKSMADAFCTPFLPSMGCTGRRCGISKWEMIRSLPIWLTDEQKSFGVFSPWETNALNATATEKLCPGCRTEAQKLTDKVRSEFWDILPTFFGLPQWADLKDE